MRLSSSRLTAIAQRNPQDFPLWDLAGTRPSLDLQFADSKSLVDATTGSNLVDFARASSGTYVGSDGLIKTATTNLLTYGEEFDNGAWNKSQIQNFGSGSIANAIASPDGSITADFVAENTATAIHRVQRSSLSITLGTSYTVSVYAKSTNRNLYLNMAGDFGAKANFNLLTGQIVSSSGVASVLDVGGGWYRCSLAGTALSTKTTAGFFFQINTNTNDADENYTGDGTSGIYIWGAQLEQSTTAGEYVKTTSTINSAPRFDHNPTTGESLGLLVEEQRTNLVRNNTMVGAVAGSPGTAPTNGWVIVNSATYTSSIIGTGVENGINYIDIQYVVAAGAAAAVLFYADTPAATASTSYAGSYYLKLVSGSIPQIRFVWQDNSSTYNRSFFDITNTLTRYSDVLTTAAAGNLARCAIGINASASGTTFVLRIGMPQIEQGAFATSVIPTSGTAVTRSADVASISGSNFSSWYRQDEGTVFAGVDSSNITSGRILQIGDGTSYTRQDLLFASGPINYFIVDGGSGQTNMTTLNSVTTGQLANIAAGYETNNMAVVLNSGLVVTDAIATVPIVDQMGIGRRLDVPAYLNGHIRRLTYWPQRLPNSTLQTITQ